MRVNWTGKAIGDLVRLHAFVSAVNPRAAAVALAQIKAGPTHLQAHPRLGERVPEFVEREVRRLVVGDYEMRYVVRSDAVWILRVWHTRESR